MLLGHTCYDTNRSAWKASASGTLFNPITVMDLITVIQTETRRLNMTVQRVHISWQAGTGSLMLRQIHCLHWQEAKGKNAKMSDQTLGP